MVTEELTPKKFEWPLHRGGYHWVEGSSLADDSWKSSEVLVVRLEKDNFRFYSPFEIADLFLEFADVQQTKDGIVAFANRYGLLGIGEPAVRFADKITDPDVLLAPYGTTRDVVEFLERWKVAIRRMKGATELWLLIAENKLDELTRRFPGIIRGLFPNNDRVNRPLNREAAIELIQILITIEIRKHCHPVIEWVGGLGKYEVRIVPKNLLGAMWWQFARRVSGEVTYTKCVVCGTPIKISSDVNERERHQSNRELCSDKCKQKRHRQRNAARTLHEAGQSDKAISKSLGIDLKTIRKWVNPK